MWILLILWTCLAEVFPCEPVSSLFRGLHATWPPAIGSVIFFVFDLKKKIKRKKNKNNNNQLCCFGNRPFPTNPKVSLIECSNTFVSLTLITFCSLYFWPSNFKFFQAFRLLLERRSHIGNMKGTLVIYKGLGPIH